MEEIIVNSSNQECIEAMRKVFVGQRWKNYDMLGNPTLYIKQLITSPQGIALQYVHPAGFGGNDNVTQFYNGEIIMIEKGYKAYIAPNSWRREGMQWERQAS